MIAAPPGQPVSDADTVPLPPSRARARLIATFAVIAVGAGLALAAIIAGVIFVTAHRQADQTGGVGAETATESAVIATARPDIPTPTPLANKPTPTPPPTATVPATIVSLTVAPPPAAPPAVAAPANADGHGKGKGKGGHD